MARRQDELVGGVTDHRAQHLIGIKALSQIAERTSFSWSTTQSGSQISAISADDVTAVSCEQKPAAPGLDRQSWGNSEVRRLACGSSTGASRRERTRESRVVGRRLALCGR
jgi:hypothetical protein